MEGPDPTSFSTVLSTGRPRAQGVSPQTLLEAETWPTLTILS